MIPVKDPSLDVSGNLTGESIKMTLDVDATAHLMQILTNLYSDPARAVIRELMTNAVDSHVSSGQSRPINIELPNSWSPVFVVQDFGLGMSLDEVKNIYSKYGASTKRDSNDVNGMLGLGAKAPLTYTSQFTMVAIKDGMQSVVIIGLNDDGVGEIQVISHTETDGSNGVTLKVPVQDIYDFNHTFQGFIRFWPSESMYIDGKLFKQPDDLFSDTFPVRNATVSRIDTNGGYNNAVYIQMAGVAYEVTNMMDHYSDVIGSGSYLINVPIGSVSFTPSREDLHYTERTKTYIAGIFEDLVDIETARLTVRLEKHDKLSDFYFDRNEIIRRITTGGRLHQSILAIPFNGKEIPLNLHQNIRMWYVTYSSYEDKYRKYESSLDIDNYISHAYPFVLDKPANRADGKGLTAYDMRKVREINKDLKLKKDMVFLYLPELLDQKPHQTDSQYETYLENYADKSSRYELIKQIVSEVSETMTWEQFEKIKPTVIKASSKVLPASIMAVLPGYKYSNARMIQLSDLAGKKLKYVFKSEAIKDDSVIKLSLSDTKDDVDYIVIIQKTDAKIIKEHFPDMTPYQNYLKEKIDGMTVSQGAKDFRATQTYSVERRISDMSDDTLDPDLNALIGLLNNQDLRDEVSNVMSAMTIAWNLGVAVPSLDGGTDISAVLKKYPMLDTNGPSDHKLLYVNAIYTRDKDSK